jgi:hypothetical protein
VWARWRLTQEAEQSIECWFHHCEQTFASCLAHLWSISAVKTAQKATDDWRKLASFAISVRCCALTAGLAKVAAGGSAKRVFRFFIHEVTAVRYYPHYPRRYPRGNTATTPPPYVGG